MNIKFLPSKKYNEKILKIIYFKVNFYFLDFHYNRDHMLDNIR